jgi:hypothetical protein
MSSNVSMTEDRARELEKAMNFAIGDLLTFKM